MCNKVIDTHAHLWPLSYLDKLKELGSDKIDIARDMNASDSKEDLEKRFEMMDKAGVKKQILSATPQLPEYGDKNQAYNLARFINDYYKKIVDKYPDRFDCYGTVCLPFVDESIKEAKRAINELGFKGIALNTLVLNEISIADERFDKFFEAINELKTIIYIHPTGNGANSCLVNDYGLEWIVGAPIEDMLISLHLLKRDFPKNYPNITFHIAHLGGGLSFQAQRLEDNYEDWNAFKESPIKSLREKFYFDAANFSENALINAIKVFGYKRILMGSDFPYFQNEKYKRAVDYIKDAHISSKEKEAILSENALRLYKKE